MMPPKKLNIKEGKIDKFKEKAMKLKARFEVNAPNTLFLS